MSRAKKLAELATAYDSGGSFGFRNRIINGDFRIDQRNAGASVTPASSAYTLDRWQVTASQASKFSVQQSSVAPSGFTNSALITSLSAYTVGAAEEFLFRQNIEGLNMGDFGWGTASAAPVTLSFWVRSSLTGTFGGAIQNSAQNRCYPFSYTISAANTWEQKSVTITGDTSGTWLTTNGVGLRANFSLGSGATNSGTAGVWAGTYYASATGATSVVGTSGATFYITGVQLEKGSTATSFDIRPYGTEVALCQRYLPAFNMTAVNQTFGQGQSISTTQAIVYLPFKVTPRVIPTGITASTASNFYVTNTGYGAAGTISAIVHSFSGNESGMVMVTTSSGLTLGASTTLASNSTSSQILFTGCEL